MKDNLITKEWLSKLLDVLKKFNLKTDELSNYIVAFTHSSFTNENKSYTSYERLEFLGDAIIEFIVSDNLFNNFENFNQGNLTTMRQKIVDAHNLSKAFDKILSKDLILKGNGLKDPDITNNVKCDVFESFIAAIYKTEGYKVVYRVLNEILLSDVQKKLPFFSEKDYKSKFQEYMQKNEGTKSSQIQYKHEHIQYDDLWLSKLEVDGKLYAEGIGKNKKESDQIAAKKALEKNPFFKNN